MGADWLAAVLSSPLTEKFFAAVVVFVLLAIMHIDIKALTRSNAELSGAIRESVSSNADHMREIRDGFKWLQERIAGPRR